MTDPRLLRKAVIDALADGARAPDALAAALNEAGVEVEFSRRPATGEIFGWKLRAAGSEEWLKASSIDRALTWPALTSRSFLPPSDGPAPASNPFRRTAPTAAFHPAEPAPAPAGAPDLATSDADKIEFEAIEREVGEIAALIKKDKMTMRMVINLDRKSAAERLRPLVTRITAAGESLAALDERTAARTKAQTQALRLAPGMRQAAYLPPPPESKMLLIQALVDLARRFINVFLKLLGLKTIPPFPFSSKFDREDGDVVRPQLGLNDDEFNQALVELGPSQSAAEAAREDPLAFLPPLAPTPQHHNPEPPAPQTPDPWTAVKVAAIRVREIDHGSSVFPSNPPAVVSPRRPTLEAARAKTAASIATLDNKLSARRGRMGYAIKKVASLGLSGDTEEENIRGLLSNATARLGAIDRELAQVQAGEDTRARAHDHARRQQRREAVAALAAAREELEEIAPVPRGEARGELKKICERLETDPSAVGALDALRRRVEMARLGLERERAAAEAETPAGSEEEAGEDDAERRKRLRQELGDGD